MRMSIPLTAATLLVCPGAAYAADCQYTPYSFQFGTDTSTQMTVKSGKSCGSNIRYGTGGGASQIGISQPAANGSATTPTTSRWQYVSRHGFTGADRFVVDVTGQSMGRRVYTGTTHITVDVAVEP